MSITFGPDTIRDIVVTRDEKGNTVIQKNVRGNVPEQEKILPPSRGPSLDQLLDRSFDLKAWARKELEKDN